MEFDANAFRARVRGKRAELDINQTELANRIGVSLSTIASYESSDGSLPCIDKLPLLAKTLGCDPNYLIGWTES